MNYDANYTSRDFRLKT